MKYGVSIDSIIFINMSEKKQMAPTPEEKKRSTPMGVQFLRTPKKRKRKVLTVLGVPTGDKYVKVGDKLLSSIKVSNSTNKSPICTHKIYLYIHILKKNEIYVII